MSITDWFARKITDAHEVTRASAEGPIVTVHRRNSEPLHVLPASAERITVELVQNLLDEVSVDAIVVVPRKSHYDWDARTRAEQLGATVVTMSEFMGVLGGGLPADSHSRPVRFARDLISQHQKVLAVEMICEASMRVVRTDGLETLTISVEEEYEFSEEGLVAALARHPDVDIVYNNNPNGRPTTQALQHARNAGVELLRASDLMSRLHK